MAPRRLRPDEKELWQQVADTAERLHPNRPVFHESKPKQKPAPSPKTYPQRPVDRFEIGTKSRPKPTKNDLAPSISQHLGHQGVQMDAKSFSKMKRGKIKPDSRIDLHGMTVVQAQPALTRFILGAHTQGKRLVLVITGKGKHKQDEGPIPTRLGVLKHEVPHWLHSGVLRQVVMQVAQAHPKHGGTGAYYVYLRRQR